MMIFVTNDMSEGDVEKCKLYPPTSWCSDLSFFTLYDVEFIALKIG